MHEAPVLDVLERPIAAGDTIVYPGREGASLWLNVAEVYRIEYDAEGTPSALVVKPRNARRLTRLTVFDRLAVVSR